MRKCLIIISILFLTNIAVGQIDTELYKFNPPAFGNGDEALVNYFMEHINLKTRDFKYQIQGVLNIKFKLTKEGDMEEFIVLDSTSSAHFNKEILDYLKMSKKSWHVSSIANQKSDINIIVSVNLALLDGPRISYILNAGFVYAQDPLLFNNYYNIGSDLASKQLYQEAIPFFDVVIKHSSADIDALYNRGVCYLKVGNVTSACTDWTIIKNAGKSDADKLILKYCKN